MPPTDPGAEFRRAVGARLRLTRRALGLSSTVLSGQLGVTLPRYSGWEHGHYLADLVTMIRLYERHQVSLDFLYLGSEGNLPRRLQDAIWDQRERDTRPRAKPIGRP